MTKVGEATLNKVFILNSRAGSTATVPGSEILAKLGNICTPCTKRFVVKSSTGAAGILPSGYSLDSTTGNLNVPIDRSTKTSLYGRQTIYIALEYVAPNECAEFNPVAAENVIVVVNIAVCGTMTSTSTEKTFIALLKG